MDRLHAMRTFVEIVDRGSLTAAADAMERSQPAIVRSLAALESHLGIRLLQRTTRRMSLTPEGQDYLMRCRQILADVEEAERTAAQGGTEPRGAVRLTGPVEFGRLHLVPAISTFLEHYPEVQADLLLLDRNVDLVSEGVDLALRIGPLVDSSLVALPCAEVRLVTVASPALLQRLGTPGHPQELTRFPCIRQTNIPRSGQTWSFVEGTKPFHVAIDGRFGVNQVAAAVSACVQGVGIGQFLSYQVQDLVAQGQLQRLFPEYSTQPWPVNLVYPSGKLVPQRQRVLMQWLREVLPKRLQA